MLWGILYRSPAGLFTYHPSFQSVAILLFTEGILVLQPTATAGAKKAGLKLHKIFQLTALPALLYGSFIIWYNKAIHGGQSLSPGSGRLTRFPAVRHSLTPTHRARSQAHHHLARHLWRPHPHSSAAPDHLWRVRRVRSPSAPPGR